MSATISKLPPLKVTFVDFPGPANPSGILRLLNRIADVTVTNDDPDIVFFSVFGFDHLRYKAALRVFFTGENVHPDFNLCDYAFGFDWISFEDRYIRCPNYLLYEEFDMLRQKPQLTEEEAASVVKRDQFCNFIYSNGNAHPIRKEIFDHLCSYQKVDSAGTYLNNTGFAIGSPSLGADATNEKILFQRRFRFSIVVENSRNPGYTSEKLVHALAAETIPIYWGDPAVGRIFNPDRMILADHFESVAALVEHVRQVEAQTDLAISILRAPVFAGGRVPVEMTEEWLEHRLSAIIYQKRDTWFRTNKHVWGELYRSRFEKLAKSYNSHPTLRSHLAVRRLKAIWRHFTGA